MSWRRFLIPCVVLLFPSVAAAQVPPEKCEATFKVVDGQWVVEEMAGAPSGKRVLVQRAIDNVFNVIVAPAGPYSDVDASVRFEPVSGREDASGGIVFRFDAGRYYVIRANALENNFRLYYYDHGRSQLAAERPSALRRRMT